VAISDRQTPLELTEVESLLVSYLEKAYKLVKTYSPSGKFHDIPAAGKAGDTTNELDFLVEGEQLSLVETISKKLRKPILSITEDSEKAVFGEGDGFGAYRFYGDAVDGSSLAKRDLFYGVSSFSVLTDEDGKIVAAGLVHHEDGRIYISHEDKFFELSRKKKSGKRIYRKYDEGAERLSDAYATGFGRAGEFVSENNGIMEILSPKVRDVSGGAYQAVLVSKGNLDLIVGSEPGQETAFAYAMAELCGLELRDLETGKALSFDSWLSSYNKATEIRVGEKARNKFVLGPRDLAIEAVAKYSGKQSVPSYVRTIPEDIRAGMLGPCHLM